MPNESSPKLCRNCGVSDFYTKEITLGGYTQNLLPLGFFNCGHVLLRICGKCGLMDSFVSAESLEKVKEKFTRES